MALIRAVATGIPVLLAAWWAVLAVSALWRREVWRGAGAEVRRAAEALDARIEPTFAGYRVRARDGRVLAWRYGLRGARMAWRGPAGRGGRAGWAAAPDSVLGRGPGG